MNHQSFDTSSGRRAFLSVALPGSALLCLGGRCLAGFPQAQEKPTAASPKHKFFTDSGMSYADVFMFAYVNKLPIWRGLEREIGSEKFIAMLKRIIDDSAEKRSAERAKKLGKNDMEAFTRDMNPPNPFWRTVLTYQIVESTPKAFELKVKECLWAKTYREANAADLGYLLICYGDYALARGFNPKMRLTRTKTLMQGDNFCNHRWVIEG